MDRFSNICVHRSKLLTYYLLLCCIGAILYYTWFRYENAPAKYPRPFENVTMKSENATEKVAGMELIHPPLRPAPPSDSPLRTPPSSDYPLRPPVTLISPTQPPEPSDFPLIHSHQQHGKSLIGTKSKGIWTFKPDGRLGNQMGEYATLYALAKLNGRQAYILPAMSNYLSPVFKITLPTLRDDERYIMPWKEYHLNDWMEDQYRSIPGDYVMLLGYPCSWTFYHHIRDEILREFTFHDFIKDQANAFLRRIGGERKNVTYVGVHVRRGDYVHVMPDMWKGVIADKKYLDTAMAYFRNKYKNVVFAVMSNGMDWSKQNIDNSKGDVFFSDDPNQSSPANDIAILAHCNHTIMTIGTFGYWASYLAGGETIYLANFTLPESPFLKLFKYEAAFLPQWIGIPADLSPLLIKKTSN